MLRSLHGSKQLAIHIHALRSFENVMQRFNFPVQVRSLASLIPGNEFHCVRQFTAEDVEAFLKITGDANSIHTDSAAAIAAGLQAPILPGIMMASLFPAIIGTNFPGAIYVSQTLKFRQPAQVGTNHRFSLLSIFFLPSNFHTRF
jgi:3-hydroxybutyryl-CoA dehydratase